MSPEELRAWVDRRPFAPFRIHVGDIAAYEIRRSDMLMVGNRVLGIGLRRDIDSPYFDEPVMVSMRHVTRVEPIIEAASA